MPWVAAFGMVALSLTAASLQSAPKAAYGKTVKSHPARPSRAESASLEANIFIESEVPGYATWLFWTNRYHWTYMCR
jgi:hypothetical protein